MELHALPRRMRANCQSIYATEQRRASVLPRHVNFRPRARLVNLNVSMGTMKAKITAVLIPLGQPLLGLQGLILVRNAASKKFRYPFGCRFDFLHRHQPAPYK
jgi:hypothetical protein